MQRHPRNRPAVVDEAVVLLDPPVDFNELQRLFIERAVIELVPAAYPRLLQRRGDETAQQDVVEAYWSGSNRIGKSASS